MKRMDLLRRLIALPLVIWAVGTFTFLALHMIPGDAVSLLSGKVTNEAQVEALKRDWGLDQPLSTRYVRFVSGLAKGDFGLSFLSGQPVTKMLSERVPPTVELAVFSLFLSAVFGIIGGVISAVFRNSWIDYVTRFFSVLAFSIPWFWMALMLIALFSVKLGWTPVSGQISLRIELTRVTNFVLIDSILTGNWVAFKSGLLHLILPAATLGLSSAGFVARITRASMLDVMRQDYMKVAKGKGLPPAKVNLAHGLRNALLPVITILGLQFGGLLGGAVIVESVFAWPGLGTMLIDSIFKRDYPVVQAVIIFTGVTYLIVNTLVDIAYTFIDPRLRWS